MAKATPIRRNPFIDAAVRDVDRLMDAMDTIQDDLRTPVHRAAGREAQRMAEELKELLWAILDEVDAQPGGDK